MLGTVMAQIVPVVSAEQDAIGAEQAGAADFPAISPSRRSVGGDVARFPRPDDRHEDGGGNGEEAARYRDYAALHEDRRRISIEGEPPPEESRRIIDRQARHLEPWVAKLGLEAEAEGNPLRRHPRHHQNDGEDDSDLTPKDSASAHTGSSRQKRRSRSESRQNRDGQQERGCRRAAGYYRRQMGRVASGPSPTLVPMPSG